MTSPWYENFFTGVVIDYWTAAVPEAYTRAEVDFLVEELDLATPSRVLDVPCGAGRHAIPLAALGHRVTAVDSSPEFLARARRSAEEANTSLDWLQADMRDLPSTGDFDGALCFGNSFGYLDHTGMRAFARALAGALRPGGRLVIDTGILAESLLPNLVEADWMEVGDLLFLIRNEYLPEQSRLDTEYTFVRDGTTERRESVHYVYTLAEVCRLLGDAGLEIGPVYANLERDEFEVACPRAYLVARRPEA